MSFIEYLHKIIGSSKLDDDFKPDDQRIKWSLLPTNIANEKDESKFNGLACEAFICFSKKNQKFTYSTQVLHPNLIRYFIKNKACEIIIEKDKIYLMSTKEQNIKTEISKQIKFGYELSSALRKQKNKRIKAKDKFNPLLHIFDEEDNIKICCEHAITNGKGIENRIDYTLRLKSFNGTPYFLGIEFLEERSHKNEGQIYFNKIQEMRWNRISMSNKNVRHLAFAWESLWNRTDGYKDFFVEKLEFLFDIYDSVNNKEEFGIQFLEKFLHDRDISEKLYNAYNDQNNYGLTFDILLEKFEIICKVDNLKQKFTETCDRRYNLKKGNDNEIDITFDGLLLDDSDDEDNNKPVNDSILKSYIIDEKDNIMINAEGLKILTEIVEEENFDGYSKKNFTMVKDIYHNIAGAAIHAINKVYDLTTELTFNDTYKSFGLDHRENVPIYQKKIRIKKILKKTNTTKVNEDNKENAAKSIKTQEEDKKSDNKEMKSNNGRNKRNKNKNKSKQQYQVVV